MPLLNFYVSGHLMMQVLLELKKNSFVCYYNEVFVVVDVFSSTLQLETHCPGKVKVDALDESS